jgi:hypothetical protein
MRNTISHRFLDVVSGEGCTCSMNRLFTSARASRHLKYGAPFFLFLFGGNYALRQFRSVRYDTDINPKAAQYGKRQCCWSMTCWCGSGSTDPCLWLIDPDPVISSVTFKTSTIWKFLTSFSGFYFTEVHSNHFPKIKSQKEVTKQ